MTSPTRPNYFLQSSRIRVDLLSYKSKPTDKRKQYDWVAENFFGQVLNVGQQSWTLLRHSCQYNMLHIPTGVVILTNVISR